MTTANKFTALGRGNGLPFCMTSAVSAGSQQDGKIDISGYQDWATLGGNKKVGGSFNYANELKAIMKLYWNLEQITGNVNSTFSKTSTGESGSGNSGTSYFKVNKEPKERVCYTYPFGWRDFATGYFSSTSLGGRLAINATNPQGSTVGNVYFVKMYNGSTSNEANFVGFGINAVDDTGFSTYGYNHRADLSAGVETVTAAVYLLSFTNQTDVDTATEKKSISYFTSNSVTFLSVARATGGNTNATPSFTVGTTNASASYSTSDETAAVGASVTSLDFYSY